MVGTIGYQLAKNRKIVAFGYHHRRLHHHVRGTGLTRRLAGHALGSVGHMLVNRIANAIAGTGTRRHHKRVHHAGSYRITGTGY